jgi:hypothetical protein
VTKFTPLDTPEGNSGIVDPLSDSSGTPLVRAIAIWVGFGNDDPLKM